MIIFLPILLMGCKKEKDINGTVDLTITSHLVRPDETDGKYYKDILLDSTHFYFYKNQSDSISFFDGYTKNGSLTVTLNKNTYYFISAVSPTYGSASNKRHYQHGKQQFISTHEKRPNDYEAYDMTDYLQGGPSVSGFDKVTGQGSTTIIHIEP